MLKRSPPPIHYFARNGAENMATHISANESSHVLWIIQSTDSERVQDFCHLHSMPWIP